MGAVLDIITVVVFIIVIYKAYRRGLVRALIEIAGFAVAFVVSFLLSDTVGQWINKVFLSRFVKGSITNLVKTSGKSNTEFFNKLVSNLPETVSKTLTGVNSNLGKLGGKAATEFTSSVSQPLSLMISRGIAFFILLAVCAIAIGIIAHMSDIVKRIPVIGTLNALAGAGVGVIEAIIIMCLLSTLMTLVISVMALQKNPPITQSTINSTQVYKYISNINPITGMLLKK